jgi:hypothetical protein
MKRKAIRRRPRGRIESAARMAEKKILAPQVRFIFGTRPLTAADLVTACTALQSAAQSGWRLIVPPDVAQYLQLDGGWYAAKTATRTP